MLDNIIQLSAKTYYIDEPIILSSDTVLKGAGSALSKIIPRTYFENIIETKKGAGNITLDGVGIYGTGILDEVERGFFADSSENIDVKNCSFENINIGLHYRQIRGGEITNNFFKNIVGKPATSGGGYGTLCSNDNDDLLVDRNRYLNIARHAIYLSSGTSNSIVSVNRIDRTGEVAINFHSKEYQNPMRNIKCIFNTIKNVNSASNDGHGINASRYIIDLLIMGNHLFNIHDYGINLQSSQTDSDIPKMQRNTTVETNIINRAIHGIRISNIDGCSLFRNQIKNTQSHGMTITQAGNAETSIVRRVQLNDNSIYNSLKDGIYIEGGPFFSEIDFGINHFYEIAGKNIHIGNPIN